MSEQLYRVCFQIGDADIQFCKPTRKDIAETLAWQGNKIWGDMIRHWVEPVPPYEPPAITHEDDLTTAAGSPYMGGDDDLLGVKPPC